MSCFEGCDLSSKLWSQNWLNKLLEKKNCFEWNTHDYGMTMASLENTSMSCTRRQCINPPWLTPLMSDQIISNVHKTDLTCKIVKSIMHCLIKKMKVCRHVCTLSGECAQSDESACDSCCLVTLWRMSVFVACVLCLCCLTQCLTRDMLIRWRVIYHGFSVPLCVTLVLLYIGCLVWDELKHPVCCTLLAYYPGIASLLKLQKCCNELDWYS